MDRWTDGYGWTDKYTDLAQGGHRARVEPYLKSPSRRDRKRSSADTFNINSWRVLIRVFCSICGGNLSLSLSVALLLPGQEQHTRRSAVLPSCTSGCIGLPHVHARTRVRTRCRVFAQRSFRSLISRCSIARTHLTRSECNPDSSALSSASLPESLLDLSRVRCQ